MSAQKLNPYVLKAPAIVFNELEDFKGLGSYMYTNAQKYCGNVAQIDSASGKTETYGKLNERCVQLALKLKIMGIKPGDVICLCSDNTMDDCVVIIAGCYLGAILSNLHPTLSLLTTTHLLYEVRPKIIFCTSNATELIKKSLEANCLEATVVVMGDIASNNDLRFDKLFEKPCDVQCFTPYVPKDVKETALIVFSSGSSGMAKGICLSHFGIINANFEWPMRHSNAQLLLTFGSFFWMTTLACLFTAFTRGTARLIASYENAEKTLETLEKYKVGYFIASPILMHHLRTEHYQNYDLSNVKYVGMGGAPSTREQLQIIFKIFPKADLLHSYGMTEVCGPICHFDTSNLEEHLVAEKLGSVGKLVAGLECKIVDMDTKQALGPNLKGELRVKSPNVMNGYYKRDSAEAWDEDGWLCTGDIGYYDEDGFFYIVDRIKEIVKFRLWLVSPSAIEAVLLQHPRVKEAVVVGIPHEIDGDLAVGIVVLNLNGSDLARIQEELVKFVEDRVGYWERLHGGLKIVESIPKTPSGKSKKMELRNLILEGKL